ncbi:diguanylate cyclase [Alteromonas sp. KUL49]|uniref:GGDEF domain-containing response regulator n=1 Tax=Alteromonas sp. KUL49 TaxID=2480798 RepID=UPI00102F0A37|nr:diguanylate cyclase [Alteromonas sp. KUL49]TAP33899.1 diguanylate cyclase [Alteromonas sp. KUL49]GEA13664.1 diguanylate cyclase response regulator [Alteromonas sp. KUL49]
MFLNNSGSRKLKDCLVLIVDDQISSRLVLETLLKDIAKVVGVASGEEALAFCDQHQPDLILLDVVMPGLDGHKTAQKLLADPDKSHIPFMFVTATVTDEEQSRCWNSGCIDFVEKPVNSCTLRNRVKSHLSHKLKNDLLEKLIYLDRLTGAYNRHYLEDFLPRLVKEGDRNTTPLSLVIFDIDYFKQFNDHYGHMSGDDCLWRVSAALKKALQRPMDKLVRIGGEEFLVLLPNTELAGATEVAQRLSNTVYELNLAHDLSSFGRVTISGGVATRLPKQDVSIDAILQLADQNLYQAKSQGRNRVFSLANDA